MSNKSVIGNFRGEIYCWFSRLLLSSQVASNYSIAVGKPQLVYFLLYSTLLPQVVVTEWIRCPLGSSHTGSNPVRDEVFIYLFFLYYIFCVYWQSVKHLQDPFHAFPQYLDGNNRVLVHPHWHGAIDKLIDEACWAHIVKLKATTALSTLALRTVWPLPALDNRNTES